MTRVEVEIPTAIILTSNQRLHWREKSDRTRTIRALANVAARDYWGAPHERAQVTCWITYPDNRSRDIANLYPTVKACIDGIVSTGRHLVDDSDKYLTGPDLRPLEVRPGKTFGFLFILTEQIKETP